MKTCLIIFTAFTVLYPLSVTAPTFSRTASFLSRKSNSPPGTVQTQSSTVEPIAETEEKKTKLSFPASRQRMRRAENVIANADVRIDNLTGVVNNHAEALERQIDVDQKFHGEMTALRNDLDSVSASLASENNAADENRQAVCTRLENLERQHAELLSKVRPEHSSDLPDPNAATKQELQNLNDKLEEEIANLKIQAQNDPDAKALLDKIREEMNLRELESKTRDMQIKAAGNRALKSLNETKTDLAKTKNDAAKLVVAIQQQLINMQKQVNELTQRCEIAELKVAEANANAVNAGTSADNANTAATNAASTANAASLTASAASAAALKATEAAASKARGGNTRPISIPVNSRSRTTARMPSARPRPIKLPRHHITKDVSNDFFHVVHYLSKEYKAGPVPLPVAFCATRNQLRLREKYYMSTEEIEELHYLCRFLNVLRLPEPERAQRQPTPAEKAALDKAKAATAAKILVKLINYAHVVFDQMWFLEKFLCRDLDKEMMANRSLIQRNHGLSEKDIVIVPFSIVGVYYD